MKPWAVLVLLALCLPPGVPALDTMAVEQRRVIRVESIDNYAAPLMGLMSLFKAPDGTHYGVLQIAGAIALVDDQPFDSAALHWWIDPGLVTDDIPAKAQATPTSTCQWRRRGEQA